MILLKKSIEERNAKVSASVSENTEQIHSVTDAILVKGFSPYIENGTWWVFDAESKSFVDTHVNAQGDKGKDGKNGNDGKDYVITSSDYKAISDKVYADYHDSLKGDKGDNGNDGYTPIKGKDYSDGKDGVNGINGKDGADGKDGTSTTHSWNGTVLTITSASGTSSADLKGEKGKDGTNGKDGEKGDSYVITDSDYDAIAEKVPTPTKVSAFENDVNYSQLEPISSLTIENYWNTKPTAASSNAQQWQGFFNLKITPIDKTKAFRIKLGAQAWMPHWTVEKMQEVGLAPASYGNGGEDKAFGYSKYRVDLTFIPCPNKTYSTQITDVQYHTSTYRPLYYLNFAYPTTDVDDGYMFGWSMYSAYTTYNTTQSVFDQLKQVFDRTIICEIIEMENCTYEWVEQKEYLAANFPRHVVGQLSIATQGRTQTGDVNQIDRGTTPFYKTNKGPVTGYNLVFCTNEADTVTGLNTASANSTANTKTKTSNKIKLWKGIWYYASSTARADKYAWAGGVFYHFYTSVDLRYSTNCSNNFLMNKAGYDVYLIGQFDSDGLFEPVQIPRTISGKVYNIEVCDETMLPTTNDGYVYVLLGQTVGTNRYSITLLEKHPIFRHNGTYLECIGIC